MADVRAVLPNYPRPGEEYSRKFMDDLVRTLDQTAAILRNPGEGRNTRGTYTNLPSRPLGLEPGAIFHPGDGLLHIVNGVEVINLQTKTEQYDNAAWTKTNATVTANSTTAPDGTVTADSVVEAATTTTHLISQNYTKAATKILYNISVHAKPIARTYLQLKASDGAGSTAYVNFDVDVGAPIFGSMGETGSYFYTSSGVEPAEEGFFRLWMTFIANTGTTLTSSYNFQDTLGNFTYLGDVTKGFYLWGSQLTAGAYPGTYELVA